MPYYNGSILVDVLIVFQIIKNIFAENADVGELSSIDQKFRIFYVFPLFNHFFFFNSKIISNEINFCEFVDAFSA